MIVDWVRFGQLVKAARPRNGVTIERLAEIVDTSLSTINRYEHAKRYENKVRREGGSGRSITILLRLMRWAEIKAEDFTR